ncbi:MAG: ribosome-associated translation inhibitor RaiA [Spirochaetes bacterium]|nr:ribosome-associated translation inhibitor RaiA [Spirochaetota bacterium]
MNLTITGRHINLSNSLKEYTEKKISKLLTYFNQLIDAKIVMYMEKIDHAVEVSINGDGVQFHGIEKAADFYSAVDLLFEKMEKQIVKYKEKHSSHKAVNPSKTMMTPESTGEGRRINLTQVSNKPVDRVEAFLEMKMDRKEFILFKQGIQKVDSDVDFSGKNYASIYKKDGSYRLLEMPFEYAKEENITPEIFIEYDLKIVDESATSPRIDFKKRDRCSVRGLSLMEALSIFEESNLEFMPFFNTESQFLNIIHRNGRDYEVIVPAF